MINIMANETAMLIDKSFNYVNALLSGFLIKFIVAVIILLIGFIIGKIAGRIVQRVLHELELNKIISKATNVKLSLEEIIGHFTTYFIYFIFIVITLEKLGVGAIAFNLIAAGIIIIIVLSVFLGIKDFIPNALSGLFIHQKGFIKTGDIIKVKGMEGKIIHINLVETMIKTKSGDTIYIPNSILTKSEIIKVRKK
jgi:small-conductance mechanosensitive channel